jgi:protein-tyrosine phosphatase
MEATDEITSDLHTWFPKFEDTMKRFLREGNGTVYVHCQAGINRSASLALLYVLKNFDVDPQALIHSVRKQRPCMFTNPTFRRQIEEFINGRVPSEKNTRIFRNGSDNRNTGLVTSRDYPESKGLEDDAEKHDG